MFERITEYLSGEVPSERIPGCDLTIYQHGKKIYRRAFGWRDYRKSEPVSPDDYYFLYSCSKVLTCSAVMHLIEEGRASLDDPVGEYIPAFYGVRLQDGSAPKSPVTLRHCFTMTGGLDYDMKTPAILECLRKNPDATALETASAIAETPLHSEPGTRWRYSLGHDVLAAAAEQITGKVFSDYVAEWALKPLGIDHLFFRENAETRAQMAAQYRSNESGTAVPVGRQNVYLLSPCYDSGGAGVIARADDFTRVLSALSQRDGGLLKPETKEQMKTGQLSGRALEDFHYTKRFVPYNYGLGVRTMEHPELTGCAIPRGEYGWDGAAGSYALIDTERELAVFYAQHVLGCGYAYEQVHTTLRNLIYEELGQ